MYQGREQTQKTAEAETTDQAHNQEGRCQKQRQKATADKRNDNRLPGRSETGGTLQGKENIGNFDGNGDQAHDQKRLPADFFETRDDCVDQNIHHDQHQPRESVNAQKYPQE